MQCLKQDEGSKVSLYCTLIQYNSGDGDVVWGDDMSPPLY